MTTELDASVLAATAKPKATRGPSKLHLVITDDTVTVYGQEVDALRAAFADSTPTGVRVVTVDRGETVKLRP